MAFGPTITVKYLADTRDLARGSAQAQKQQEKTASGFKSVAKQIGGALAVGSVVAFGKASIDAAADLNESLSKVGVVFGDNAKDIEAWSKNAATSMGQSQQQALEAAGTFGNLFRALDIGPDKAADLSKNVVNLAGDLASFNNADPTEVLDALRAGLVGETEPLRRFGVNINQARLEAEALRLGLAKGNVDMVKVKSATLAVEAAQRKYSEALKKHGKNSLEARQAQAGVERAQQGVTKAMAGSKVVLSAAAKTQASYSLIMKDTALAQGDFARTSDGLANKQRIASARFKDLQAQLGQKLMPIMNTLVEVFLKYSHLLIPLGAAVVGLVAVVKLITVAQAAWNAVTAANPIVLIVAGIVALVAAIVLAYHKVDWFRALVDAAWQAMQTAFHAIVGAAKFAFNWIKKNWPLLLAILTGPIGIAIGLIVKNWDTIKRAVTAVIEWIKRNWRTLVMIITGPIGIAVGLVIQNWDRLKGAITGVINFVRGVFDSFVNFITGLPGRIASGITALVNAIKGPINAIIDGINALEFTTPKVKLGKWPLEYTFGPFTVDFVPFDIPHLAGGGRVMSDGLAFLHAAEVVTPARDATAMGNVYQITVEVPPTASPVAVGRAVVDAIRSYEGVAGTSWRRTPSGRAS